MKDIIKVVAVIVAIVATTAMLPIIANAAPPMGPVAIQAEVGPTQAILDKEAWLANQPKHRDFGPLTGVSRQADSSEKVTGLQAEWSNTPLVEVPLKDVMSKKETSAKKRLKKQATVVASSVAETGKAYGQTFATFGKSLARNFMGE